MQATQEAVVPFNNSNNIENGSNAEEKESPYGPIMLNGVYNEKAHYYNEEKRVERDLTIPTIVEEIGKETCNFITVRKELGGTKHVLIYHPNPEGIIEEGLEWVIIPAISQGNGGRFYKKIANGRIEWYYFILRGDILSFMTRTFAEAIMENEHRNNLKSFSKKAAKFITDFPHEENGTYGCYLIMFVNLISAADGNLKNADLQRIAMAIAVDLKRVLDYNDRNLDEKQIYIKVRDISVRPKIQQCSKNVHYRLSLIDQNAKKASFQLDALDKLAEEEIEAEKKEKAMRVQAILGLKSKSTLGFNTPKAIEDKKRKIEEVEKNEEEEEEEKDGEKAQKKRRIDEPSTSDL